MRFPTPRIALALAILSVAIAAPARGALIIAGATTTPATAIQDITLLPSTPFNPTSSPILIRGVSGIGSLTFNRDAEQANNTINIPSLAGGMFFGSNPLLGSYVFGNIAPLTGANFSGSITNVVQNPSDPGFAPNPARTAVFWLPKGSHASPTLGLNNRFALFCGVHRVAYQRVPSTARRYRR